MANKPREPKGDKPVNEPHVVLDNDTLTGGNGTSDADTLAGNDTFQPFWQHGEPAPDAAPTGKQPEAAPDSAAAGGGSGGEGGGSGEPQPEPEPGDWSDFNATAAAAALDKAKNAALTAAEAQKQTNSRNVALAKAVYDLCRQIIPPSVIAMMRNEDSVTLPNNVQKFYETCSLAMPYGRSVNPISGIFLSIEKAAVTQKKGSANPYFALPAKKVATDPAKSAGAMRRHRYARLVMIALDMADDKVIHMTFREADKLYAAWLDKRDAKNPKVRINRSIALQRDVPKSVKAVVVSFSGEECNLSESADTEVDIDVPDELEDLAEEHPDGVLRYRVEVVNGQRMFRILSVRDVVDGD